MQRISGEPIFCDPPPDTPKWAVDANFIENEDDVSSVVVEDVRMMEPAEPPTESTEPPTESTEPLRATEPIEHSEAVTESESDSDFNISLA